MAKIRIIGGTETPDIEGFISLERTLIVLADLRCELPKVQSELQREYPGVQLHIEYKFPRLRNPIEPGLAAGIGLGAALGIGFCWSFTSAFGKQLGQDSGKAISRFIKLRISELEQKYNTRKPKKSKATKTKKKRTVRGRLGS